MSKEVRGQKLDSIARCLNRIDKRCPPTVAQLRTDIDLQESLILNLERLVQLTVDLASILVSEIAITPLPDSMKANFIYLKDHGFISEQLCQKLVKAVGFRNLCVHEYDKINWDIVFKVATTHLEDFREFSRLADSWEESPYREQECQK